jgi:hypothetical protein
MNLGRIILGGLLSGVIIVVGELLLNGVILAGEWEVFRQQLGLSPTVTTSQIAWGVVITLLYGIVLIWIYAAIRPRFGAGPKTAVIAGLVLWILAYVLFTASLLAGGMISTQLTVTTIAWGVFEAPIAAVAGAYLYHEDT